jgi:prevent-host-death family protein
MKSVNITELKNHLSVYMNEVKAGEEILVRDRNRPVARIVPLARSRDEDDELLALASAGKLRLGEGVLDQSFWEMPAPRVSAAALRRAVDQERDDNQERGKRRSRETLLTHDSRYTDCALRFQSLIALFGG